MDKVTWHVKQFSELHPSELYGILHLREKVFTFEQECPVYDMDFKDHKALHCFAVSEIHGIAACARIFPPGDYFPSNAALGRIAVLKEARGLGFGKRIVGKCIEACSEVFGGISIEISAQAYLEKFYREFGFETKGAQYIEDDILHHRMVLDG